MSVKRFQTRIALKRDTETNWYASDFALLNGELGYSRGVSQWRPNGVDGNEGLVNIDNFKIGDGSSVWKDLWFAIPEIKMQTSGVNGEFLTTWEMNPSSSHGNGRLREYSLTGINSNLISLYVGNSGSPNHPQYAFQVPDWIYYQENGTPTGTFGEVSKWLINHDHALKGVIDTLTGDAATQTGEVINYVKFAGSNTHYTRTFDFGNGLHNSNAGVAGSIMTVAVKPKTNGYISVTSDGVDVTNIDSNYTAANSTNLATVATVTAAIGSLNTGVVSVGGAQGVIGVGNGLTVATNSAVTPATNTLKVKLASSQAYLEFDSTEEDGQRGLRLDPTKIDSNYTAANSTNLATVGTVTSALGNTLNSVTASGSGYLTLSAGAVTGSVPSKTQAITGSLTTHAVSTSNNSTEDGLATAYDVKTYVDSQILNALDSEVTFRGVTSTKPTTGISNGDMWKTSAAITFTAAEDEEGNGFTTKAGDTIIAKVTGSSSGSNTTWYRIPSADDIEDTWRPVYIQSTQYLDSSISGGSLVFGSSNGNPVGIQSTLPTQANPNLTVWFQHDILADPSTNSPWTARGAVKIKTDSWGHVRTDGAITASDITRTATTGLSATNVENALLELAGNISSAAITIDGYVGAITTGNGLNHVSQNGGEFSVKLDSSNAHGLSVSASGIGMSVASDTNFGTVQVSPGNGLSISSGVISYAHNTASITVASLNSSTNVITINGTLTPNASDAITPSNALSLAPVAATGAASDVSVTTSAVSANNVESAIAELAGNTAGTLDTTNTTPQSTSSNESLHGDIDLHKVAKTGTITDLYQAAPSSGNTVDLVIFDCGTATTNTNS